VPIVGFRDYKENERQDRYDMESADDEDYDSIDMETRQLVEAKLRRRDRERARLEGRLPPAFLDDGKS
jgi:DNA replication licensing factor MCM2